MRIGRDREDHPRRGRRSSRPAPRAAVVGRELLGRARVLVDLRLHRPWDSPWAYLSLIGAKSPSETAATVLISTRCYAGLRAGSALRHRAQPRARATASRQRAEQLVALGLRPSPARRWPPRATSRDTRQVHRARWRSRPDRRRRAPSSRRPRERSPGTPSMSAWNCISQALATAPPSAFSAGMLLARRGLLGADGVDRLVGDRLQRGAGEVGAVGPAGEADDRAPRVGIPVRRPEPGQRRDEVDVVVRVERGAERLGLGCVGDDPEPVAQPLDRGAGDEDRGLERVVRPPPPESPGDRGEQPLPRRSGPRCRR